MPRILVIDDDPVVRNTISKVLNRDSFEVFLAENGTSGIDSFRRNQPDLVITDIIMPDKEGIETIREIRRIRPDAKIIAISGGGRVGNPDFLKMARSLGASDVISKPFGSDELLSHVRACLMA
jgi:DNA-binding response OmpR family regulator